VLAQVLAKLAPEELPFTSEVIVLDNCSEDGSVAMVRAQYPWVRLFPLPDNRGALSRNLGIEAARGEYVVMLDDDSYPLAGAVSGGLQAFCADSGRDIGCIAFNIQRPDGSFETAGIYTAFTGCGAMFRRSLFDEVGGYPDDYLFYVEEYDVSCRIWGHGYRVVNPQQLQVLHFKTGVSRDFNQIMRQLVRNNMLLWSKYLPPDLAERQIETELWRYQRIARKEDAVPGYEEGFRLGSIEVERYRKERRHELPRPVAEQFLTLGDIRRRIAALDSGNRRQVLVWNVGKQLYLILDELKEAGWEVVAIADGNPFMQGETYQGVEVVAEQEALSLSYDTVLIGSSSLALNDSLEARLNEANLRVPVVRMCDYDDLDGGAA
jgi:GT2 family glycosyltransferase